MQTIGELFCEFTSGESCSEAHIGPAGESRGWVLRRGRQSWGSAVLRRQCSQVVLNLPYLNCQFVNRFSFLCIKSSFFGFGLILAVARFQFVTPPFQLFALRNARVP